MLVRVRFGGAQWPGAGGQDLRRYGRNHPRRCPASLPPVTLRGIVSTDVMVGKTRRVTKSGIANAQNQIAGFVIVEAADITAATGLFQGHPHITVFPGDGIDVMPVVTGPPED
jgi:hypothetical protein